MTRSIVHALAPARFGGLESVVRTLASGQATADYRVTVAGVFSEDPRNHPFWSAIEATQGVRGIPLVLRSRRYSAERAGIRDILQEARADILHTHGYRPDVLLGSVGKSLGVRTVSTVHGFTGTDLKNRFYEWLQRRALRRFDAVVAVSRKLGRQLEAAGVPGTILHVLPNAWAADGDPLSRDRARKVLNLPLNRPVVGWVGRMSQEKAPELALEAVAALESEEAHLSFIGDGPMKSDLENHATRAQLGNRVHWHGIVLEAASYLRAFDALLITSWTEGTPLVLLEAMSAGVPVVTTAVGGIPDVVSEAEAALVEAGDTAAMARQLAPILAGDTESERRSGRAKERLQNDYAVEPWVQHYEAIYRSLDPV